MGHTVQGAWIRRQRGVPLSALHTCSLRAGSDAKHTSQEAVLLATTLNAWAKQKNFPGRGSLMVYIIQLILDLFLKA